MDHNRNENQDIDTNVDRETPEIGSDTGVGNRDTSRDTGNLGGESSAYDDSEMNNDDLDEMEELDDSDLI